MINPYDEARWLIEKHGWIQFDYGHEGEGFCLLGALRRVCGEAGFEEELYEAAELAQLIRTKTTESPLCYHSPNHVITSFNDSRSTTKEDIVLLLKEAGNLSDRQGTKEIRIGRKKLTTR